MGAVEGYSFSDFSMDVQANLDQQNVKAKVKDYEKELQSIFDEADKSDGNQNGLYEPEDDGKINELVRKGVNFVQQQFAKGVVENLKKQFDNIKMFHQIKELEKNMSDKSESSSLAKNTVEHFGGNVPEWGVTWFCNKGGNLFDLQQAIDEYATKK